jgi:hypothetical protein
MWLQFNKLNSKKHYKFWHNESEIFNFISETEDFCFDGQQKEENFLDRKTENISKGLKYYFF